MRCVKRSRVIPAQSRARTARDRKMTRRRPDNRDQRNISPSRLDEPLAVRDGGVPANAEQPITGIVGDASATTGQSRSGEDTRRRGWFWHWNSVVTQFAPIIGLKGVGLLNSYTVWTDRREESPHRGYAFPSQQNEAAFYGEDRNELITINKLLVALDLIEIRKEMVPRTDDKGRRWKVPHNLYRVKDQGDEFTLTAGHVMHVARLADKDRAVYRYVRRIFSPKFAPIDRDNIWHQILDELRPTEVWQRLAARAERDEHRASARSKAGHASRRASDSSPVFSLPQSGDMAASEATVPVSTNDSDTGATSSGSAQPQTFVARTNNGPRTSVAQGINGLGQIPASIDALANNAGPTSVDPASTTYYQTLTTTTKPELESLPAVDSSTGTRLDAINGPGPIPDDRRDEEATVRLFDEANGREATAAARRLLKRIAVDYAGLAQDAGVSGWALVGSAIDEAVASGSAFVAPKRVREIVARWDRDGVPAMYAGASRDGDRPARPHGLPVTGCGEDSHSIVRTPRLPGAQDPVEVWEATCRALGGSMPQEMVDRLRVAVRIVGYGVGEVVLQVSPEALAARIHDDWRGLIQRKLSVVLRRPVRIVVSAGSPDGPDEPGPGKEKRRPRPEQGVPTPLSTASRAIPVFMIQECGMSSTHVWISVLDELRSSGAIPRTEVDTWLRDSRLIGRDADGDAFVVGVPHALAERRATRFRSALESATMHIVGFDCQIEVVRTQAWLAAHDTATGTEG